jgi:ubiquitin-conjugating enzyme E2 R
MNEYQALSKEPWTNVEVGGWLISGLVTSPADLAFAQLINDNIMEWKVALIVLNPDSLYYRGYFIARMSFPENYPYLPPGASWCCV